MHKMTESAPIDLCRLCANLTLPKESVKSESLNRARLNPELRKKVEFYLPIEVTLTTQITNFHVIHELVNYRVKNLLVSLIGYAHSAQSGLSNGSSFSSPFTEVR